MRKILLLLFLTLTTIGVSSQQRSTKLTIEVTSVEGDMLAGQAVTLLQTDYEVSYGTLKLDADGRCQLKVYAGNHCLSIERDGFEPLSHEFNVPAGTQELTVNVTLREQTRTPYALTAIAGHDIGTGRDYIDVSWNTEQPAFFDDFESYEGWSVQFGEWTGIDADGEVAAALLGSYPNRNVMQYAQIINPLTVEPTWWYDYPILRPYDGQQYVGFTRTSSGNANDDWLISPAITVGVDNVLQFMGKAADRYTERFMVYVTTKLDNPTQDDFIRIDLGNYETADYRGWKLYSYDLGSYEGLQIKYAIRYVSHYNFYGSFMLMVDNVYVGPVNEDNGVYGARLHRTSNPNEHFRVFLDGELAGTTDGHEFRIENVTGGQHVVGVQAVYLQTESDMATVDVYVPENVYAHVVFNVTANSIITADGQTLSLLNTETTQSYAVMVNDSKAELVSLPMGRYLVNIEEGAFEAYQTSIDIDGDATFDIILNDHIMDPYNITAICDEDYNLILSWNQTLFFSDSFEDYDDFATGSFGGWKSVDMDQMPVYPIGLPINGVYTIIGFPGSGIDTNPMPIAPMVFNPWKTTPPMLPTDPAIAAPTGDKTIIFFSPQRGKADKWLISPLLDIHEGYQLNVKAKGYSEMYPEYLEFCVSEGSDQPSDFRVVSETDAMTTGQWMAFTTDLSEYAGKTIRVGIHYLSYDAFFTQIDDFTVGRENEQGETVDYGNVVRFDIFLDGEKVGESQTPHFVIADVVPGYHVVGIRAIYLNGESKLVEYVMGATEGIADAHLSVRGNIQSSSIHDLQGRHLSDSKWSMGKIQKGIYIRNGKKIIY